MTTHDVDAAFKALNIEPLYGHFSHMNTTFRRVVPQGAPPVYFVEDEEVDFDKVIKEEKIVLPKVVSWHAHWLAVEGVQPLVPENPPRPPVIGEQRLHSDSLDPGTSFSPVFLLSRKGRRLIDLLSASGTELNIDLANKFILSR